MKKASVFSGKREGGVACSTVCATSDGSAVRPGSILAITPEEMRAAARLYSLPTFLSSLLLSLALGCVLSFHAML